MASNPNAHTFRSCYTSTCHAPGYLSPPGTAFTFHIKTNVSPSLILAQFVEPKSCLFNKSRRNAPSDGMECRRRRIGLMSYKSIRYYWVSVAEIKAARCLDESFAYNLIAALAFHSCEGRWGNRGVHRRISKNLKITDSQILRIKLEFQMSNDSLFTQFLNS